MKCHNARQVFAQNTIEEMYAKMSEIFPLAAQRIEQEVYNYVNQVDNGFNDQVHSLIGSELDQKAIFHHFDDNDPSNKLLIDQLEEMRGDDPSKMIINTYFSQKYDQPIFIEPLCCSSHSIMPAPLNNDLLMKVQKAAISIHIQKEEAKDVVS